MHFYLILVTFLSFCKGICSVTLDENGFYNLVVAISEKTLQNSNEKYLENLKVSFQDFADAVFESTTEKDTGLPRKKGASFAIRSVDILVPDHWEVDSDVYATTQTFQNADIRISHEYASPQAINPIGCSYPGNYIELPYSFFDESDTGPYGPTGKALLTVWARYRWGVHEEHGFPGDTQFPYFWRKMRLPDEPNTKEENWTVSNCTDKELTGKYLTLEGEPCGPSANDEDDDKLYPPGSDCRFHPEIRDQKAFTSLMSFTYVQSLTDFCDKNSHEPRAPTRQNHFCWFQSIWDIIRQSPDYLKLKKPIQQKEEGKPRVNFRIVKKTGKPLLYILAEGVNPPPPEVVSGVSAGLGEIFNGLENWNVLTEVGVFPGTLLRDSYETVYSWKLPWYNPAELQKSFQELFATKTGFRNFGAAIHDVGNQIKAKNHEPGAVILIIKFGSEPEPPFDRTSDFQKQLQTFEGDVLATVLQQNIKLFAIEGEDNLAVSSFRLKNIAELSGGQHFPIEEDADSESNMKLVTEAMSAVKDALNTVKIPTSNRYVAYKMIKETYYGITSVPLYVHYQNVRKITFYMHLLNQDFGAIMEQPSLNLGPIDESELPQFEEHMNWGKDEDWLKSYVATYEGLIDKPSYWEYNVDCHSHCFTLMVAIVELVEPASPQDISISITTSAEADDSLVDLTVQSAASLKGTAFSIYAKLEKNGHPINNARLEVNANLILYLREVEEDLEYLTGAASIIKMADDGLGTDMTANDGIFTGNYIPNPVLHSGDLAVHEIFVTAELKAEEDGSKLVTESPDFPRLPTYCGSGWGGCWSETVEEPFMIYADLPRRLEFIGSNGYDNLAASSRITDLTVIPSVNDQGVVTPNRYNITWTEPFIQRENGPNVVGKYAYQILYTENIYHIVDFSQNDKLILLLGQPEPRLIGQLIHYEYPDEVLVGRKLYFVVRAWGVDTKITPVWSNIAFLNAADPFIIPTTTTSTTTEPPLTPTTTGLPPREPKTTTGPSRTTTTPTTTAKPTWPTASTRRPTTTSTPSTTSTTTNTPARRIEETPKHWYQTVAAIATFSVFGALLVSLLIAFFIYYKFLMYQTRKEDEDRRGIVE